MTSIGHGFTEPNSIFLIDEDVNFEEDECGAMEVSEKVLHGLFARHKDLNKLVNSCSLDLAHARRVPH
jgi:hypothetical protein